MNRRDTQALESLILVSSLERKRSCHLFHIYWKCHQLGTQMGFRLVLVDARL